MVTKESYKRVLDILFVSDDPEPAKTFLTMTLRFMPSSGAESQITIRSGVEKTEVVENTSLSGSVYGQLNELLGRGELDNPNELAKHFLVRKRKVNLPVARMKQWHVGFLDAIARSMGAFRHRAELFDKTREESLPVHGAFYDLWYKQGLNTMSFSLYDYEVNENVTSGETKLVQWMNTVRLAIEKLGPR